MKDYKPRGEKFERGLKTRRSVLGDVHVERSLKAADDFDWPMQKFATEFC